MEFSVHARDDTAARSLWPDAAVFGIGSTVDCGRYAQYLFDEHQAGGGRTEGSCARLVADRCFRRLPVSIARLLGEVDAIDSRGGAHAMHLNNLLKTCHLVQYSFGRDAKGRAQSGGMTPGWKRAIVNSIVAAVLYCLENGVDFTAAQPVQKLLKEFLNQYEKACPYAGRDNFSEVYERLRSNSGSVARILSTAKVQIDGVDQPQLLVAPFLAQAATIAWGREIAYFLMVALWEAEILSNLHFRRAEGLLEKSFLDRDKPKTIYTADCSMGGLVLRLRFTGKEMVNGKYQTAPHSSPVWILGCRHNNFLLQANKAMNRFLTEHNFGVGLVWCENTKESTKVVFKGTHFPQALWLRLVAAIQEREPDLWYHPVEGAPFIINGNAAHRYVQLSALTPANLARLCINV